MNPHRGGPKALLEAGLVDYGLLAVGGTERGVTADEDTGEGNQVDEFRAGWNGGLLASLAMTGTATWLFRPITVFLQGV